MHTTTITKADRGALENLWNSAGGWIADTWTRLNNDHFDGQAKYHGVVWGLTPHGGRLGHTYSSNGRITLHPALLDPQSDAWDIGDQLGAKFAEHVLLHEMIHAYLGDQGLDPDHNGDPWCAEIMRITPQLGLDPIKAEPVKPRRINGKVTRRARDGFLSRDDISRWPHTIAPAGYYSRGGRIRVPI
jgi:hypothetical protein